MAYRSFSQSVAAGASFTPLNDWNFRTPDTPGMIEVCLGAAAAGCTFELTTGPEAIVQSGAPISTGFAAGTLPSRLNSEVIVDAVLAGQEIVLKILNPTGGAVPVQGWVTFTPKV